MNDQNDIRELRSRLCAQGIKATIRCLGEL